MKITRRPGTQFRQMFISAQIGLLVAMVPSVGFAGDSDSGGGSGGEGAEKATTIGFAFDVPFDYVSEVVSVVVESAGRKAATIAENAGQVATIGFDVGVLRTLGSIRLVVGAVALIPTSILYLLKMPIDGDAGALMEVVDILVVEPAEYIFRRPLGEDLAGD
ncbi:MAG: hypothetical protein VCB25_08180 [Myxococcota bacterium]